MYGVFTLFGVVIHTMHCPHFTMQQCEDTLLQMKEPTELEAKNYCSEIDVPKGELTTEQWAAVEAWTEKMKAANDQGGES